MLVVINSYYRRLYNFAKLEHKPLGDAIKNLDFPEVAKEYRLIKNDMINIVVPFDEDKFEALQMLADDEGLTLDWIKQARGLSISFFRPKQNDVIWNSLVPVQSIQQGRYKIKEDWFMINDKTDYDAILGYKKPEAFKNYVL